MLTAGLIAGLIAGLWCAHLAVRGAMAWRFLDRRRDASEVPGAPGDEPRIVVLQPILSGDPDLASMLASNLAANPGIRFVWLVDDDDAAGRAIAASLAEARVTILQGPPPVSGENPKLVKLERGLAAADDAEIAVVLDDDTLIEARELRRLVAGLGAADLATGLPLFVADRTVYERLIGGWVNGNAILTYLPAAAAGVQRTINGMIYATPVRTLRSLGGFAAVAGALTDDFALASRYLRHGRRILQVPAVARVSMTVRQPGHAARVMRRWLLFANRYLRENRDGRTAALVVLPALLAAAAPLTWIGGGWPAVALWLACLAVKASLNRRLVARWTGAPFRVRADASALAYEMLADLLLPAFYLSSLVRPAHVRWRSRRIEMRGDRIHYR